jgi:hypothetical protein
LITLAAVDRLRERWRSGQTLRLIYINGLFKTNVDDVAVQDMVTASEKVNEH